MAMGDGGRRRTVYIVRHAESRYNDAKGRFDVRGLVKERDHGLSRTGVEQCASLRRHISSLAARGDADATSIASRRRTLSSPLCRAVLTAHLALPRSSSAVSSSSSSRSFSGPASDGDGSSEESAPHVVVALPDARERCLMPLFARDSEGTPRDGIGAKIDAELSGVRRPECQTLSPDLFRRDAVLVDASRVSEETWWTVGETEGEVKERLSGLLGTLYEEAAGSEAETNGEDGSICCGDGAVVLVAHSRIIRTLFSEFSVDGEFPLLGELGVRLVGNCAVLRVTLRPRDNTDAPEIVDADFVFNTGFR